MAFIFAAFTVLWLRADQIITGTAITLLSVGLTGAMYRAIYGATGASLTLPTAGPITLPLARRAFRSCRDRVSSSQPAATYFAVHARPGGHGGGCTARTPVSRYARSASLPAAAEAAGIRARRARTLAMVFGGAMGGFAGATLVLSQAGTFAENMSAGRGFIAIAVVALGRWHPLGAAVAALVFGAASALQFLLQSLGLALPYQLFLALPYLLTLAVLAGVAGRVRAPAASRPCAATLERSSTARLRRELDDNAVAARHFQRGRHLPSSQRVR